MNVVWVASMPRTGSMWVMNVARTLLMRHSLDVRPQDSIPADDADWLAMAAEAAVSEVEGRVWVLKVHKQLQMLPLGAKFLVPFRDLRDAMASFQRFVHCDFETAVAAARVWARLCEHYLAFPDERRLLVNYDLILDDPSGTVGEIAEFLELEISPDEADSIATEWDREKVRSRLAQQNIETLPAIGNFDGSTRGFDPETGFQEGHVSSSSGRGTWETYYSEDERCRIESEFGEWLRRQGFVG